MSVYIPCLNPDVSNNGSGSSLGITPGGAAIGAINAGVQFTAAFGDSLIAFTIAPYLPFLSIAINWQFWADLFGLGEGRIAREKATIQQVMTPIFQYLNVAYNVPIRDFHALIFPSDGVQAQFNARPDIAALVPQFMLTSPVVTRDVFAVSTPTQGELERTVNQFLANASLNGWPVQATTDIWNGLVDAASPDCSADPARWLKNPAILRSAAIGGMLLQYIPLSTLLDMAVSHHIGDPLLENLILLWANNPSLVANIVPITGLPWQHIYTEGTWALPPYGSTFGTVIPLLARDHILPLLQGVTVPAPQYPSFVVVQVPQPPIPIPQPQPQPQPPPPQPQPPPPPPPSQPPNVVEIPPQKQDGTQFTQAELDYACQISRLLYGSSQLTDSERAWIANPQNNTLLNYQINNPQCMTPIVRQPQTPQAPKPPEWTQAQLDYACYISKLLYGNSQLTAEERAWLDDPRNTDLLNSRLNDPVCKTPLVRQQPGAPPQLPQGQCPPPPQTLPRPQPQPQPQPQPIPPGQQQPCPPDCLLLIDQVRQHMQECCDELHQNVLPRLADLEQWIVDLQAQEPGPVPQLPYPYPIPPVGGLPPVELPPIGPGEPGPEPPEEPPTTTQPVTPVECERVVECIALNCGTINEILKQCKTTDPVGDCAEGIQKWGQWAECWLKTFTVGVEAGPNSFPPERTIAWAISNKVEIVLREPGNIIGDMVPRGIARLEAMLGGNLRAIDTPLTSPIAGPGYIFENTRGV